MFSRQFTGRIRTLAADDDVKSVRRHEESDPRPLVSVGMPVFNGERFLREAIESVLNQRMQDLELVISDNGSTDDTEHLCRQAAARDPRVRYFREPANRGAAWNYNRVLELSRGLYFHWAASDDIFDPSYVERCVETLSARREAVLAFTTTKVVDGDGQEQAIWRPRPDYATQDNPSDRFRDTLWHSVMCFEVFGLTRRDQLLKTARIGAFTGSDRALLAELSLMGEFAHIDAPLFLNRVHGEDSMHTHPDPIERARWFDPSSSARFPTWRLLLAFAQAAWFGSSNSRVLMAAIGVVPRWMWRERGALGFEALASFPEPVHTWAVAYRARRSQLRNASRGGT